MNFDRIYECDFINGPGARTVLFVTGCNHKCPGCYNKSTWNPMDGTEFTSDTLEDLKYFIGKPYINGLTITGGDPLYPGNVKEITKIAKEIKTTFPDKDIWLWTGYEFDKIKDLQVLSYIDVIIDNRYDMNLPTKKLWRGSDNQRMWKNISGNWVLID